MERKIIRKSEWERMLEVAIEYKNKPQVEWLLNKKEEVEKKGYCYED